MTVSTTVFTVNYKLLEFFTCRNHQSSMIGMFWTFFVRRNSLTWVTSRFIKIGSLSNNDDDGSENITKKMNLRPFKGYRVYLEPLNSSNVSDFSWS